MSFLPSLLASVQTPVSNFGTIISDNYNRGSLGSNYTVVNPSATISIVSNKLRFVTSTGGFTNYCIYNAYPGTSLINWTQVLTFTPVDKTATSFGISIGLKAVNSNSPVDVNCFAVLNTAAAAGKVRVYRAGVQVGSDSAAAISWNAGDTLQFTATLSQLTLTLTLQNLTTPGTNATLTYTFPSVSSGSGIFTCGQFTIFCHGGTQDVSSWVVSSTSNINVSNLICGDSITRCYSVSSYNQGYAPMLVANSTKVNNIWAAPSNKTVDLMNAVTLEGLRFNAVRYFLMIGGNDLSNGVPTATWKANYSSIVSSIKSAGHIVTHLLPTPRNATDVTPLKTYIQTTFGTDLIIDTYTPLWSGSGTSLNAAYDSGDGTHPNSAGHTVIYNTIVSAYPNIL